MTRRTFPTRTPAISPQYLFLNSFLGGQTAQRPSPSSPSLPPSLRRAHHEAGRGVIPGRLRQLPTH